MRYTVNLTDPVASVIRVRGARTHNLRKRATVRAASGPLHGSGLKAA